ncbi:glycosyltransferase, partial [Gardnerella greenwoodii]
MTKATSAETKETQEMQNVSSANSSNEGWEVVNRVVYPVKDAEITMPLYVIPWHRSYLQRTVLDPRMNTRAIDINNLNLTDFKKLLADTSSHLPNVETQGVCTVLSRNSLCVDAGKHVSLCTFFNAFPASYWQHWTRVKTVKFTARVEGEGELQLMRSTGRGLTYPVQKFEFDSAKQPAKDNHPAQSAQIISYEIPMTGLADGGYFWFDAKASDSSRFTVSNAEWSVPCANKVQSGKKSRSNSTFSIAITTFNRPSYCHNQLKAVAENKALRSRLDTIYCTDQGTDLVKSQPGFNETSANLGSQLTYIQQANLGGSGGFSRGMFETLKAGKSSYTMLLDDDAISETECILRALQFADYTIKPAIIGGGMLHLDNRTVLYTQGERFTRNNVWMK